MATATIKTKNITQTLKYEFSEAEQKANSKDLARLNQALVESELKKKQVVSDLKAESERIAADIAKLARYVNDGYDFRLVDCLVQFHEPKKGKKSVFRKDTGEVVEVLEMEEYECQQHLFQE